ncbi:hypothetical protein MSPP1_003691 [Malassezia sp. CBS 17886]|nr:hypothetical protein MSPP1_003691 [Malassezia sp. CBS 17886]
MSSMDATAPRTPFSPVAPHAPTEPGASEFDSYIHSDLCAGGPPGSDAGVASAFGAGFLPGYTVPSAPSPPSKPAFASGASEQLPALSLEWSGTPPSSSATTTLAGGQELTRDAVPIYAFGSAPVWAPGTAGVARPDSFPSVKSEMEPSTALPQLMLPKPEDPAHIPGTQWYSGMPSTARPPPAAPSSRTPSPSTETALLPFRAPTGAAAPSVPVPEKRRKLSYEQAGTADKAAHFARPRAMTSPVDVSPEDADPADPTHAASARSNTHGPRRAPPSASQVTEAGLPFPVIDTSARHSSLFIPPDTSGLTKREARLVKNRAAAFLSRQRKREQFEELGGKCKLLARLAWLMWDSLAHACDATPVASFTSSGAGVDRVLAATRLGEHIKSEPDEFRVLFQQVIAQQGSMVFDGVLHDEHSPSEAGKPASEPDQIDELRAQLAGARAECVALRAEARGTRGTDANAGVPDASAHRHGASGAVPDAPVKAEADAERGCAVQPPGAAVPAGRHPGAGGSVRTSHLPLLMLGAVLEAARAAEAVPPCVVHALSDVPSADVHEDPASLHLHLARTHAATLLCTLTTDIVCEGEGDAPTDAKRWRCSTPTSDGGRIAHHAPDGASDASLPSLASSSASPTLSSLSSTSASHGARQMRRVLVFRRAPGQAASPTEKDVLQRQRPVSLDAWAAQHVGALATGAGPSPDALTQLRALMGRHHVDATQPFMVAGAAVVEAGAAPDAKRPSAPIPPLRISLHAAQRADASSVDAERALADAVRAALVALMGAGAGAEAATIPLGEEALARAAWSRTQGAFVGAAAGRAQPVFAAAAGTP